MLEMTKHNRIGLYEKALPNRLSWEEKLQKTKQLGFDFLEISVDESDERRARLDWDDETIYALREMSQRYGVPFQSMCLSAHRRFPYGSADAETRQQAEIHMEKAIILAYKLGIRTIQLAGYDVYYEPANKETHRRFIEGMKSAAKLAEKAGIMLAVEIMDTSYLNSLSKFEILQREVNSPCFTAYPDVGNISGWNYDVCTELRLAMPHISQIHIKDSLKVTDTFPGQFRDLVLGDGQVDFDAIFTTFEETNCVVPLVIEMWAQDEQWEANIVRAKQRVNIACQNAQMSPLFSAA